MPLIGLDIVFCTGTTSQSGINITMNNAVSEPFVQDEAAFTFTAFPNPAENSTQINYSFMQNPAVVTFYDIKGRKAGEKTLSGTGTFSWGEDMGEGIYLYRIEGSGKPVKGKIVLTK
jgi:hypothetical protein